MTAIEKKRSKIIVLLSLILLAAVIYGAVTYILSRVEQYRLEQEKAAYPIPEEYATLIFDSAERYQIPPEILCGIIRTESGFRADAVSYAGAIGLMQVMPSTRDWLAPKLGEEPGADLTDPAVSLRYGCFLLSMLYDEFENWDTVFAAYNAGINRVRGWLKDETVSQNGVLVKIPIEETETYVVRVNASAEHYRALYFTSETE